jgi:DUF971 family protein
MIDPFLAFVFGLGAGLIGLCTAPLWFGWARSHFVSKPVRELAARIRQTEPSDWVGDQYVMYCEKLDITLWLANEGYALKLWLGRAQRDESGWYDSKYLFKGGNEGEAIWRAWRSGNLAPAAKMLSDHLGRRTA